MPNEIILGLGGNIGDPVTSMATVIETFKNDERFVLNSVSRLYKTPPWGNLDQPDFYNACLSVASSMAPEELLDYCLDVERGLKRERIERWGPRTIDIDILLFDNLNIQTERLTVPHPRMHERAFVLLPLADLGHDRKLAGKSISYWLERADKDGIEIISDDGLWWRERTSD